MASVQDMAAVQMELQQSQEQNRNMASTIDTLRADSHKRLTELTNELQALTNRLAANERGDTRRAQGQGGEGLQLIDLKTFQPNNFGGGKAELYKPWAKKGKSLLQR